MALGKKLSDDDQLVYCLCGDGEMQEGQIWEAAMFGAHHKVDNLIALIDRNGQQIDGPTKEVISLPQLKEKWAAFGWLTLETQGNDMEQLLETLSKAKSQTGKGQPIMIVMHTEMGAGVDFMEGSHKWHGVAPNNEQQEKALAQLSETLGDYPQKSSDAQ